ncbi:hypothetical protein MHYP_G00344060 [Metynnis hypsauchen]
MQVYDQELDGNKGHPNTRDTLTHESGPTKQLPLPMFPAPQAVITSTNQSTLELVKVLADALSANRIPVPEPSVFSGDPLKYSDWKLSFETLIDQKNIQDKEKIYYLRRYVCGQAKNALEGYFLLGTESAYASAWEILEERYGNPFTVAKAYRDKLQTWPKIGAKDSFELREFVDFLRSCEAAMVHIKALEILDDCNENRKILSKLPDWLIARWSRKVLEIEEKSNKFPSFSQFVEFLTREAKIACNPVTSLQSLKQVKQPAQEVLVYALLDTQSDTTFVLREVADALEADKEQVKLKLSTMTSRTTVVSSQRMKDLQVRGFYSSKKIFLPPAYTRDFIPVNRAHIPTGETAKAWPHLEHLQEDVAPLQDCEVGLLIGYNCSQALLPREVVSGKENEPYAQRTDLGWSIVGCRNPFVEYGDAIGISHRVVVKQVTPYIEPCSNLKTEVHYVNRSKIKEITPSDILKVNQTSQKEREKRILCLKTISSFCQRWEKTSTKRMMVIMKCHYRSKGKDQNYQTITCVQYTV